MKKAGVDISSQIREDILYISSVESLVISHHVGQYVRKRTFQVFAISQYAESSGFCLKRRCCGYAGCAALLHPTTKMELIEQNV